MGGESYNAVQMGEEGLNMIKIYCVKCTKTQSNINFKKSFGPFHQGSLELMSPKCY